MSNARTFKKKKRSGQALLEYVILISVVFSVTIAFTKFYVREVWRDGLKILPAAVSSTMSHP